MNVKKKIGWQKYEDLLQDQIKSPLLDILYREASNIIEDDEEDVYEDEYEDMKERFIIPVNERLMENISLATNFDCWMGHTNFNVTEEVKQKLSKTEGVEILKICSRYRFFIGVGRMFDFTEIRRTIEKTLTGHQGENFEQENRQVLE